VILYFGAAILGRVSGDMIMTDPTTTALLHPSRTLVHLVEATLALGVVLVGWWWRRRAARRAVAEVVAEQRAT
jgi:predicted tellurium resistance membrane protein TerC